MKRIYYCLIIILLFIAPSDGSIIYNVDEYLVLNQSQLVDIFTKKQKYWSNGNKITVYIKPVNSVEHKVFVIEYLNISYNTYRTKIDHEIYSGNNSGLIEVKSDTEMLLKIGNTPDSIGYIDNKVLVRWEKNVKILSNFK